MDTFERVAHDRTLHVLQETGSTSRAVFLEYRFIGAIWPHGEGFRAYSFVAGVSDVMAENETYDWLVKNAEQKIRPTGLGQDANEGKEPSLAVPAEGGAL